MYHPSRFGLADSVVPQQGPNYALAKRLQRWRAVVARESVVTSANVAPATRTRSVTKNKVLAAAYAGAASFGVEVFEVDTSRALMAALLLHDLRNPSAAQGQFGNGQLSAGAGRNGGAPAPHRIRHG